MANLIIDLSNYRDTQGGRVPPGRYRVQVDDIEETKTGQNSKNPGTPMLNVHLRVLGGEYDGTNILDRLTLSPAAMFRVVGFLQGLGIKTPRKRFQINPASLIGRVVDIDVEDGDPFRGTVRSEVRGYVKVEKSETPAPEAEDDFETDEEAVEDSAHEGRSDAKEDEDALLDLDTLEV